MSLVTGLFGEVLTFFYEYTGDYGVAIICLTVLVKFCMFPVQFFQKKNLEASRADLSGCLLLFLQLIIMICLYRSISLGMTEQMGTKLFPWVQSLLIRDKYGILPILSVIVQLMPQLFPYLAFFQSIDLPKPGSGMLLSSVIVTFLICFPLPSGVGIYYLVSGMCSALEQLMWNVWKVCRVRKNLALE